jgi:hypothetical protein
MRRRGKRIVTLAALAGFLVFPAAASAVDPEQTISPGSDWFSGSLIQQPGQNCSVLGEPYTEIMISGVGSYGGAPGGGVVNVNENYYAELLVAIPGNPCGSGSSSVATDLVLPAHTSYDPSRQIRCFGQPSNSNTPGEITNQTWNFLGHSGRYCPTGPNSPASGIGQGWGFRPLASGQLFWIFVPLKTTQVLTSGSDEFNWLTTASAAYANPGRSYTNAWVFEAGGGGTPYVYFANDPAAIPFWDASPDPPWPSNANNKVEFFANAFTAGQAGYLHYEIRTTDTDTFIAEDANDAGYNGSVGAGASLVQVQATGPNLGPNGGYVPFYYEQGLGEWNRPMKITWTFAYDGGASTVSDVETFRTLSGPDLDSDGVADSGDACPGVQGTLPNGCLPTPKMDGSAAVKKGAKIKRRGQTIEISCNLLATATAKLTIKRALARNLGVISAAGVRIGGGKATCKPAALNKLKLRLTPKAKRKLARPGKERATLTITFKQGSKTDKVVVPVKIA